MNLEELKAVLELVQNTTGMAADFGLLWMWLHYGLAALCMVLTLAGVLGVAYTVYRIVVYTNSHVIDTAQTREWRERLGIGSYGIMTSNEYRALVRTIDSLITQHLSERNK